MPKFEIKYVWSGGQSTRYTNDPRSNTTIPIKIWRVFTVSLKTLRCFFIFQSGIRCLSFTFENDRCLNRYSPANPFHSRFQNTILPNLVPNVKLWENSITLKKGKKKPEKKSLVIQKNILNSKPHKPNMSNVKFYTFFRALCTLFCATR